MKKFILLLATMGLSLPVFSQVAPFLEKGKSGLGISAAAEQGYTLKGCLGTIGGSYKGLVDVEVAYYSDQYDQEANGLLNDQASSSGFVANATWWLARKQPTQNIEVNLGLVAGFQRFSFSDYTMRRTDNEVFDADGYSEGIFGVDTRIHFQLSKSWFLMPGYCVTYNIGQETNTLNGVETTDSSTGLSSKASVSLFKRFNKGNVLSLTVSQGWDTYNTGNYYQLSVGYVLAL